MRRATQNMLSHLLPVVFWLLAIGGSVLGCLLIFNFQFPILNCLPALIPACISLTIMLMMNRIKRHGSSVEQCFGMGLLLGIASYWLPTIVLLALPVWVWLILRNLFSFRSFLATLIGLAAIAIWAFVLNYFSVLPFDLSLSRNVWAWIPTGAFLLAWIASTIARRSLRAR